MHSIIPNLIGVCVCRLVWHTLPFFTADTYIYIYDIYSRLCVKNINYF